MALVLIKEDGSGKADANSYAAVADADAYFEGHLYASAWTGATTENKEKALVFATRLIDAQFQFNGGRVKSDQALQWPRLDCRDPDELDEEEPVLPEDVVPAAVLKATCEQARELLIVDRTASPAGEGIQSERTAQYSSNAGGATSTTSSKTYSKGDTRPIISHVAQAMLSKYGALVSGRGGAVRLVRT